MQQLHSNFMNAGFLFYSLKKHGIYTPKPGWGQFFAKQSVALFALTAVALTLGHRFNWLAMHNHQFYRALALSGVLTACIGVYFLCLFLVGFRFRDFKRTAL